MVICACKKNDQVSGLAPTINISPAAGYSGSLVTITGSGFSLDPSQDSVTFNGKAAVVVNVAVNQLIVVVPDSAGNGPVVVYVGGKSAKGPSFSFTQNSIVISGLSQLYGLPGTEIFIHGRGFLAHDSGSLGAVAGVAPQVSFNGILATLLAKSDTLLATKVPQGAGTGPVGVTLGGNTVVGPVFTYTNVVSSTPKTGGANTTLIITGTGFVADTSKYRIAFGGIPGTLVSATTTQLTVVAPAGVANSQVTGSVPVTINGLAIPNLSFAVVPPPTFASMTPLSGPSGTNVTINGTGFSAVPGETIVSFNGAKAAIVNTTPLRVIATVPSSATTGPVVVTVNGQSDSATTFALQNLGISAISPGVGGPGTTVTLTGFGFNSNTTLDTVRFNGAIVPVQTATANRLTVTMPPTITSGPVTVSGGGLTAVGPAFYVGGQVLTYAGGTSGTANGVGTQAQFYYLTGLAIDASGDIWVADQYSNENPAYYLREILPGAIVTNSNLPASLQSNLSEPYNLVFDPQGDLYVADYYGGYVTKINPTGAFTNFSIQGVNISRGSSVALDAAGNVYFVGNINGTPDIYEWDANGNVIKTINIPSGVQLYGAVFDAQGNLYVTDQAQGVIFENGNVVVSGLGQPEDITIDQSGKLILVDASRNLIYGVDPANNYQLTVIAGGGGSNQAGFQDGDVGSALFNAPTGVKVDAQGNIWVADQGNSAVREIILH